VVNENVENTACLERFPVHGVDRIMTVTEGAGISTRVIKNSSVTNAGK